MSAIAQALALVKARIDAAAKSCGRDPSSITLVAVSKTKPPSAIREAYEQGQRAFGESYAQELAEKRAALADLPDIEWHFIGHLQTNKAKVVAKHARVVHAVDSAALAKELGKRALSDSRTLRALCEVKLSGEPTKHGCLPAELEELLASVEAQSPALRLVGLMTMPPPDDLAEARRAFETLVSLRNLHGGAERLPELSMGMTADLEVAVACGATIVRVGTAIFGSR